MDDTVAALVSLIVVGLVVVASLAIGLYQRLSSRIDGLDDEIARLRRERAAAPVAPPASAPPPLPAPVPATPPVAAPPAAAPGPVAAPRPTAPDAPRPAPPAPVPATDAVERFLGGRVLLVVGVIAVLVGIGFFLRLAIERGWVRPEARVIAGAAFGVAAIAFGDRVRARGLSVFGQAVMGCGLGALFLCDWFASVRYGFYDRPAAFVLAALVAASGAVLAVRRSAPFLAWLGFAGAWLAPAMLGRNEDALEGLTLWLVATDLGLAATLAFRAWPGLDVAAAVATVAYLGGWEGRFLKDERLGAASACLAVLAFVLVVTALGPAIFARRRLGASFGALGFSLVGTFALAASMLFPDHRTGFGLGVLAAAACVLAGAEGLRRRVPDAPGQASAVQAYAYALLLAAIPVLLRGDAIAPAWAAAGVATAYAAGRGGPAWLLAGATVALGLAAVRGLGTLPSRHDPVVAFVNGASLSALAPWVALFVAGHFVRRAGTAKAEIADVGIAAGACGVTAWLAHETWRCVAAGESARAERAVAFAGSAAVAAAAAIAFSAVVRRRPGAAALAGWAAATVAVVHGIASLDLRSGRDWALFANPVFAGGLAVAAALFVASAMRLRPPWAGGAAGVGWLLVLFTVEWLAWGRSGAGGGARADAGEERRFAAQVGISVTWALHAAALVGVGFWRGWPAARWAGLAIFLVTVAKVFVVDLDGLDTAWRVTSFLGLGALLVAASYLYQRTRRGPSGDGAA